MKFEVMKCIEEVHVTIRTIEVEAKTKDDAMIKASMIDEDEWEFNDTEFDRDLGTPIRYIVAEIGGE